MLTESAKKEFENTNDDDDRSKLVYAYFGLAGYWIQCLEQTFENMIILGTLKNQDSLNKEFVDNFYYELDKSKDTMGGLLRKVKRIYSISEDHIIELSELLEKRNYLIHGYFKANSFKWVTNEGKLEMILEFVDFVQKTVKTDKELNGYYRKYLESFGVTELVLNAELEARKIEEIKKRKFGG